MKQGPNAGQLRGAEVMKGTSKSSLAAAMSIASSPTLMGLSDVLDGTADWLNGQNGSLRGLLGGNVMQNGDRARELKLADCLKELASFQRAVLEELQEEDPIQPKDLNSALFQAGLFQPKREKDTESVSSDVGATVSEGVVRKGGNVGATKNSRRREVKDVQQRPWSFSTKSSVRPLKVDVGLSKPGERMTRVSKKSPVVVAKPRQYIIHSNPLATGRRLSATPSKRRESLVESPTKCRRMSNSPSFKPKSAEKKKNGVGLQASNVAGRMKPLERTPTSKGESKGSKLTDRQKELLKRVMINSPMAGKKRIYRDKAAGLTSSVDLSAAARRARRLSQVLRSEHEIKHQNQEYAKELQQLRRQYATKEEEVDRAQSAGMLLRQVCSNQAEELKAYKNAFPTLMKDMSDLRENYHKQEKELQLELSTKLSLQAEVSKLRDRVDGLTSDIKQTRTLNTVLAERVHQYEKSQCTSCRLHINQKPMKKEISPLSGKNKVGSFRTPPRPRSDSLLGRRNSPKASVTSMKEGENIYQQERKKTPLKGTGEQEQNDSALHERCENISQGLSNADGPPVDALKNRISSLLFTASQALENQHRAM
ncbi:hypothetical protein M758_3G228200 [Ceratodon purpureus]|nr:hypothetical protein M758_3G228200 [Ceratodon purpureus]